jgi:hypothetical protein
VGLLATPPATRPGDYWTDGARLFRVLIVSDDLVECEDCRTYELVKVQRSVMRGGSWRKVKQGD